MKKLNRSKLLSLVTVGAIVVTTAFSFAAWDTLKDTATTTAKIDKKITTTASKDVILNSETRAWGDTMPVYSGDITFEVTNVTDPTEAKLVLEPVVTDNTDASASSKYTVSIEKSGTPLVNNEDTAISVGTEENKKNKYTVKVTPTDDSVSEHDISIDVAGTLVQVNP